MHGCFQRFKIDSIGVRLEEPDWSSLPAQEFDWSHTVYGKTRREGTLTFREAKSIGILCWCKSISWHVDRWFSNWYTKVLQSVCIGSLRYKHVYKKELLDLSLWHQELQWTRVMDCFLRCVTLAHMPMYTCLRKRHNAISCRLLLLVKL
jgi:hypothetical protein